MKLLNSIVLVLSIFCANEVLAQREIQYNYGELRFIVDSDLEEASVDGDGFAYGGSLRLDELFYVTVDYETIDYDLNTEITDIEVGVGLIFSAQLLDAIAELAVVDKDIDNSTIGDSDTGIRLTGGLRYSLVPQFELRGTVNRVEIDDFDDTFFTIAGDYFLNNYFSIGIAKDLSADIDNFSIGMRLYIGE